MARISAELLEQIRSRIDLVEMVGEYVPGLKRAGRHFKACCPFHQEKTPSFLVSPEKQIFHCFGCGEGGDLIKFLMKIENLAFPEAVEELAARAGLRFEAGPAAGPAEKEKLEARKALEFAVGFYGEALKTPAGQAARAYLQRRRIPAASVEEFRLGWAPAGGSAFLEAALGKGLKPQSLQRAGLVGFKDTSGRYYDYFRERLLFPIVDARGDVVGFGGRLLGEGEPKYLNSPDTLLFSKGRVLYGIRQAAAALRAARRAIILEGYTDVIACHRHGFKHAVAPLGTALTPEHAALLKRFCEEAVVLFDPDTAGAQAALRGAELLMEAGLGVMVATLPGTADADEFLDEKGTSAFEACLKGAADLAEYKTGLVLAALPPKPGLAERVKAAGAVLETIGRQPNLILRKEWLKRLAARLDLDPGALEAEMERRAPKVRRAPQAGAGGRAAPARPSALPAAAGAAGASNAEEELLQFYLKNPSFAAGEPRPEGELTDARVRRVFESLKALVAAGTAEPVRALAGELPEEAGWLSGLALAERDFQEPEHYLRKHLAAMRGARLDRRRKELETASRGRELTASELLELQALGRELKASVKGRA